jgi:hypothetical protein
MTTRLFQCTILLALVGLAPTLAGGGASATSATDPLPVSQCYRVVTNPPVGPNKPEVTVCRPLYAGAQNVAPGL